MTRIGPPGPALGEGKLAGGGGGTACVLKVEV